MYLKWCSVSGLIHILYKTHIIFTYISQNLRYLFNVRMPNQLATTGSSCCICFFQVTVWCSNSFTHQTRCKSYRVEYWDSTWAPRCVLALLLCIIHEKMGFQLCGCCRLHCSYCFVLRSRSFGTKSYSFESVGDLVPFSERHTEYVSVLL